MITIAWIGSILLATCAFPELLRTLKTRQCTLSWGFLLMWFFGEIFVFIPVVAKNLGLFLVFNYGLNILMISVLLYFKLFPKKSGEFKAGDKVTAFGNVGEIKRISANGMFLEVKFAEFDSIVTFRLDGKMSSWHKTPSLEKLHGI
jgi:hypothetical protein